MEKEVKELEIQNTWILRELPNNKTFLTGKQVYKIKIDLNNNIIKYKARQVKKEFI